jgi:hypothetical protein
MVLGRLRSIVSGFGAWRSAVTLGAAVAASPASGPFVGTVLRATAELFALLVSVYTPATLVDYSSG